MLDFDFKTEKSNDCVLIDATAWICNSSNLIQKYKMSGKNIPTYITKVLDENISTEKFKGNINIGDTILLSRIVSDVAQYQMYAGPDGVKKYYNVPFMQIIGVFKDNIISFNTLNLLTDKVLYKKVKPNCGMVQDVNDNTAIGEVLKVGKCKFNSKLEEAPLSVSVGDYILVKDNVSTEITLDGETFFIIDDYNIIGSFNDKENLILENVKFFNGSILLVPYISEKLLGSELLWTPIINYEELDYSDIYCRNQFKIAYLDENLTRVKKGDIVIVNRDITYYVYFQKEKFFSINGIEHIAGRRI